MTGMPPDPSVAPDAAAPVPTPPEQPASTGWAAATQSPPAPGPVAGLAYASVLPRFIAFLIDVVLYLIAAVGFSFLLGIVLVVAGASRDPNDPVWNTVSFILTTLVSAGYFILAWRERGATLGMRVFGLIVGNAADGQKLDWGPATIRWLAMTTGPIPTLIVYLVPAMVGLVFIAVIVWWIALLVTTATSPTKQGLHDRLANSLVVKRA